MSRTSDISTPAGIRVGDSGTAVLTEYGSHAVVEAHRYWEAPARYVTVWRESDGDRRGIRYEINADDEVAHIRGGGPSISTWKVACNLDGSHRRCVQRLDEVEETVVAATIGAGNRNGWDARGSERL